MATTYAMARALHDIQSLLLLLPVYDNILVIGIKAMVGAPEVAAAAVAVAMVAEDGLEAARWSCLPIKSMLFQNTFLFSKLF